MMSMPSAYKQKSVDMKIRKLNVTARFCFVLLFCVSLVSCSYSSSSEDYRRVRESEPIATPYETQTIKKQELVAKPYRRLAVEDGKMEQATSSSEILAQLLEGNRRVKEGEAVSPHQSSERRQAVVAKQSPKVAILSCSDSRVPPEIVFDQGIGDLFVVRNAGEVADDVAVGSLEYAVEHLGVKLIVVLGHQSCGAVKATLETPKGKSAGSKDIDAILSQIRPNIKGLSVESAGPKLESAVLANTAGVSKTLMSRSKIIREAVTHHGLLIVKGLYHLDSGAVDISY